MHVWDEFSEFLPENRVPTSADFNTYPIRIFLKNVDFRLRGKLALFCKSLSIVPIQLSEHR